MAEDFDDPKVPVEHSSVGGESTEPSGNLEHTAPVYRSSSDPYRSTSGEDATTISGVTAAVEPSTEIAVQSPPPPPARRIPPPPPPPPSDSDDDAEEGGEGMLRMSFMEHLEELRSRILKALVGLVVAFLACIIFANELWRAVSAPAVGALKHLGVNPPDLVIITPMESFNIIWLKLPLLVSVFVGSPWILFQVWSFISPGLYKRERRWAVPFILSTAGLFIAGGCFAYFVAFRFGLEFLLGIGRDANVRPMVSVTEYFDLFVNVTLGVGIVFEMPIVIFFLTLLRLASPRFLIRHSRYAILGITILAAVVTPTPDVFNMMIFAVPMVGLFFVGVFASYLLVMKREGKKFPWGLVLLVVFGFLLINAGVVALLIYRFGYHLVTKWPFLLK